MNAYGLGSCLASDERLLRLAERNQLACEAACLRPVQAAHCGIPGAAKPSERWKIDEAICSFNVYTGRADPGGRMFKRSNALRKWLVRGSEGPGGDNGPRPNRA